MAKRWGVVGAFALMCGSLALLATVTARYLEPTFAGRYAASQAAERGIAGEQADGGWARGGEHRYVFYDHGRTYEMAVSKQDGDWHVSRFVELNLWPAQNDKLASRSSN